MMSSRPGCVERCVTSWKPGSRTPGGIVPRSRLSACQRLPLSRKPVQGSAPVRRGCGGEGCSPLLLVDLDEVATSVVKDGHGLTMHLGRFRVKGDTLRLE